MTSFFRYSIFLFFLGAYQPSFAQVPGELNYRVYGVEDGLPSSEVYQIVQDHDGYYWIATDRGVSRFDGRRFESFTTEDGLDDNTIFGIHVDPMNRPWFYGYNGGLSYYHQRKMTAYEHNMSLKKHLQGAFCNSIAIDTHQRVYANGAAYSLVVDSGGQVRNQSLKNENGKGILYLTSSSTNNVIERRFTGGTHVEKIVLSDDTGLDTFRLGGLSLEVHSNASITVLKHESGIYISGTTNLVRINPDRTLYQYGFDAYLNPYLYIDDNNSLWVASANGCFEFPDLNLSSAPNHYYANTSITSIYQDSEGGHWFTTLGRGIRYVANLQYRRLLIPQQYQEQSFKYIFELGGIVYLASDYGTLLKIDRNGLVLHKQLDKIIGFKKNPYSSQVLLFSVYRTYLMDEDGGLRETTTFSKNGCFLSSGEYLYHKYSRRQDTLILGLYNLSGRIIQETISPSIDLILGLSSSDTGVFFTTQRAAYHWNLAKNRISQLQDDAGYFRQRIYFHNPLDKFELFSSAGGGIKLLHDTIVVDITTASGLHSNYCDQIYIDSGRVWAGARNGLSRIDFDSDNYTLYDVESFSVGAGNGIGEVIDMTRLGLSMYVLSPNGVVILPANGNERPAVIPKPVIHYGQVMNSSKLIPYNGRLQHNENDLIIAFGASTVQYQDLLEFECSLAGKDTQTFMTGNRDLRLVDLKPGKYTFGIRTSLGHTKTPGGIDQFQFEIIPAFWQTLSFKLGAGLLILLLTASISFYLARQKQTREQLQRINETTRLKAQLAQEQLNLEKTKSKHLQESNESKKRELVSLAMAINEKNSILDTIRAQLKPLYTSAKAERSKALQNIQSTITSSSIKENGWDLFVTHFTKVHPHFIDSLRKQYPQLSSNELKYCTYIKINLSNKEIAQLLNVGTKAVEMAKYRIRKKMNLQANEKLEDVLLSLG